MNKRYMDQEDFDALLNAVGEAGAIMRGESKPSRRFTLNVPNVVDIRDKLKLSRAKFAQVMGVSARTVEGWEQGRRQPTGAARIFLVVAAKHPRIVAEAVAEALEPTTSTVSRAQKSTKAA